MILTQEEREAVSDILRESEQGHRRWLVELAGEKANDKDPVGTGLMAENYHSLAVLQSAIEKLTKEAD